ncbi:uncharacterized protein LOC108035834 isoform X3 [Drosophila biarmipes]|uniref:uncharacterized protein LOC108035834 isoform X1 n=1 Tax=Drosophila biarmipes TaxID=125945 RepID=UPI0007E7A1E6|nr:uncharacterized protein LOC108035834 isoform X1 [Drosophila biarmipes]XP_050746182.1 uncharacterized protein LOC108035834 isoform X3 [Drosophila biarmipes]
MSLLSNFQKSLRRYRIRIAEVIPSGRNVPLWRHFSESLRRHFQKSLGRYYQSHFKTPTILRNLKSEDHMIKWKRFRKSSFMIGGSRHPKNVEFRIFWLEIYDVCWTLACCLNRLPHGFEMIATNFTSGWGGAPGASVHLWP